ncbi:SRPBCC family protein [Janibacter anophelis]|uniref:SRPBCC family protein n=1 Tax=Janibacter anophelis TaxID=319054 RepID=UPI000A0288CE|nr:SRPBCC family protein [Janibacter anophelis]
MSFTSDVDAVVTVHHEPRRVAAVLMDAERLPAWNPAFTSVTAGPGSAYRVHALGGALRGTLEYVDGTADIAMLITVPGLREESTWVLEVSGSGTRVTHRIRQQGALVPLIGAKEAAMVPHKRLARLQAHLGGAL